MHVAAELLKLMPGLDLVHVAYRGPAAAFTDLFGGQVQAFIITVSTAIGPIRAGKVQALAVTGPARSGTLPDVPAVSEILPGFETSARNGIGAPKAPPAAIIDDKLQRQHHCGPCRCDAQSAVHGCWRRNRADAPSAAFASSIVEETEKWAKVVRFSGAKVN